jgi:hypothetical protein
MSVCVYPVFVLFCMQVAALYYIKLHYIDPKLVKMTVDCGICHIDTKHVYNTNKILI